MIDLLRMMQKILSVIKTIYFNYRYLPIMEARYLPIKVSWDLHVKLKKHDIIFMDNVKLRYGMVKLGFSGTPFIPASKESCLIIKNGGKLLVGEDITFAEGLNIYIDNATLSIDSKVYFNRNILIQCENGINIASNSLFGWNVNIRDTDGHELSKDNSKESNIHVGQNVWVASDVFLMRGTSISDGSIVGTRSLVLGLQLLEKNCLVAGSPAVIKRKNITLRK